MADPIDVAAPLVPNWWRGFALVGVPLPIILAAVDSYALRACHGDPPDWVVLATYALFVAQTALLAALVGLHVKSHLLWWAILAWGILLVDLQVFVITAGDQWSAISTIGFAFASSQIGALICFGVLGAASWPIRVPTTLIGLALVTRFAFALSARDSWYVILSLQSLATAAVCLVLRLAAFRIERIDLPAERERGKRLMQFSIRHLFYWTTGVAVLVGVARLIRWRGILGAGLSVTHLTDLSVFVPLLTLVSIVALWAALGRDPWWLRVTIVLLVLPSIGTLLGLYVESGRRQWWERPFPVSGMPEVVTVAVVWSMLAGLLLAGLLLVFRTSGQRLQRRPLAI